MQLIPHVAGVLAAVTVVLLAGRWFRRVAWRLGLVDGPKLRGVHAEPVAKSGGMTIVAALTAALLAQMMTARGLGFQDQYLTDVDYLYLLMPAFAIAALGLLDDIRPLGALPKLCVQGGAAVAAWFLLFRIDGISVGGLLETGTLSPVVSLALTVVFIVAVTNAFNMIDGVDGLCGGAAFIALLGIGVYSLNGGELRPELALPLGASALAFLRFNFARPRAFLGDSGSMLIGFLIATLSLRAVVTGPGGAVDAVPLFLLLSLPLVDITAVFFRRVLEGSNPLVADRGHIHHILLLQFNHSVPRTTGTLLFMAALAAAGAVWWSHQPALAAAAVALPFGLYLAVYASGGFVSWRNLRSANAASHATGEIAREAEASGAKASLDGPLLLDVVRLAEIRSIVLVSDEGERVWSIGTPDAAGDGLVIPLYASGRVRRGRLLIQGHGRAGAMAFAAHLLLPLYPAFMELLAVETADKEVERVTARIRQAG